MPPRTALIALVTGAALALVLPAVLLGRLAARDVAVQVAAPPPGEVSVLVARAGRSGSLALRAGPYPPAADARYAVRVVLGINAASARVSLVLLGAGGRELAGCRFEPDGYAVERYRQSALLACPLRDPTALRAAIVSVDARPSEVRVDARRTSDGEYKGGVLLAGDSGGVGPALERLGTGRPAAFGGWTLIGALALSLASLAVAGAAALTCRRRDHFRPAAPTTR